MNYSNLMDAVNARIKANGRREITGDILNDVLRAMVVELGASYQLGGTIRPGDKPKGEDLRVAYLAVEPGMYLYAGGFEVTELSLITYGAEWHMYPLGVPFGTQIAEDIAAAVDAEKTRAMAAEGANASAITAEADARAKADTTLQGNINAEESERKAADQTLQDNINAEETRAMAAEGANASAITAEADARAKADTTLQGNIDKKQDIIVDLSAIREESANGQTAFSWGDHAEAGYVKPFVITITGDGTAENPYRVVGDIDVNKVQNALNAHNLILLNIDDTILPLTEAFRRAENVSGITLQFVTMYGDGYEREEYIINIAWDGVTIDYYDYMYVTYDQIHSEETERKAADQTLQANIDEKVDKSDGIWLENFMPRIQLNGDGTTSAPTVGDNWNADYQDTSYYLGKYGGVVTPFDDENVHGRVVQVKDVDDNKLYVTAIFNNGADFSDNFANSLYEIVLNFAADDSFESGTYTVKPLGGGGLSTIQAGRVPNSVYLEYEGLGGNNEPIFIDNDGTALTRGQICRLLGDKSANQVVLINTAASDEVPREQTSTAKFLQVEEDAFIIEFVGANADGQIFDILYKWDATEAKVLRAELLYNPTA